MDKPKFLQFWVNMAKMTFKVKVTPLTPIFNTNRAQICDELSCGQRKGLRTDRRADAGNDNTPAAWNAKG